jgi:RNA polymerase sigma-70 factor (ECF subfamily)
MARHVSDALVRAAQDGDEDAWRRLYSLHAQRLVGWLGTLPMLDSASSADDIASQVWLTAASKIHDFRGSDDDFGGWLFAIARNHARNNYRKSVGRQTRAADIQDPADVLFLAVPPDAPDLVEALDAVRRLLAALSPREAEVVACIDVVGLDVRTTATALGMKPTAVRVARHRALGRLRKLLAVQGGLLSALLVGHVTD